MRSVLPLVLGLVLLDTAPAGARPRRVPIAFADDVPRAARREIRKVVALIQRHDCDALAERVSLPFEISGRRVPDDRDAWRERCPDLQAHDRIEACVGFYNIPTDARPYSTAGVWCGRRPDPEADEYGVALLFRERDGRWRWFYSEAPG